MVTGDYFPAELPGAAAKKAPRINTESAEEPSAPTSPRVCFIEADAPDKLCPDTLAGEHHAPAGSQILAVEANVPTVAFTPLVLVVGA